MTKIDLDQLAKELKNLQRHQKLYKVLKVELTKLGFWRIKPRGNPSKGWAVMKEVKERKEREKNS
jgi:hypothetical protein